MSLPFSKVGEKVECFLYESPVRCAFVCIRSGSLWCLLEVRDKCTLQSQDVAFLFSRVIGLQSKQPQPELSAAALHRLSQLEHLGSQYPVRK